MSANFNIGVPSETRSSSRVLKPPGGGHTDIFAPPAEKPRQPRPNYNQQNSASMCEIMGRNPDDVPPPNNGYEAKGPEPVEHIPEPVNNGNPSNDPPPVQNSAQNNAASGQRGRVPPGGFSSGFW